MVQWIKLLCICAYGVMLANVGMKIYNTYNKNSLEELKTPQKPEFWYGKTFNNKDCRIYVNRHINNTVGFEDFITAHEGFVHRHLHNKTAEIECFLGRSTDKYELVKYTRTDVASNVIETVFYFHYIEKKDNPNCAKLEIHLSFRKLDGGIVQRKGHAKCHLEEETKTFQKEEPVPQSNKPESKKDLHHMAGFITFNLVFGIFFFFLLVSWKKQRDSCREASERQMYQSAKSVTSSAEPVSFPSVKIIGTIPKQDETPQTESAAIDNPVVVEDDNISNAPEEIAVFTVPEPIEIQSEAESDLEESTNQASIETDNSNVDVLTPVDMDMSSEEATFEYIN